MQENPLTQSESLEEALGPKQIHLIRNAYTVMGEKGVNQLSLQDIADAAGVSKAILLYYFGSKENLILLTMQWVLERTARRIRGHIVEETSAREQIVAMIDAIFIDTEANRRFYLTFFDLLGYAARADKFGDVSATFRSAINRLYVDIIRRGVEQREFAVADVEEAGTVLRAIIDGLFTQWVQEREQDRTHAEYRALCKRAVLHYLTSGARNGAEPAAP